MRKILYLILVAAFSIVPITASATYIGTDYMDVNASDPNWGGYRADYDLAVNPFGGSTEVFCVEDANMDGNNVFYDFYTIGDDLANFGVSATWIDALKEATWYANWFLTSAQTEPDKKTAQVAIWSTMNIVGATDSDNALLDSYNAASDQDAYLSDWYLAVNPHNFGDHITMGEIGQNYLVQAPAPVPEPSTLLLLGSGLLGLAYYRRRKSS